MSLSEFFTQCDIHSNELYGKKNLVLSQVPKYLYVNEPDRFPGAKYYRK